MRTRGRLKLIGIKEEDTEGERDTSLKFRPICHPSEGLRKYLKSWPAPPGHALRLIVSFSLVTVTLLNVSNIVFFNEKRGDGDRRGREKKKKKKRESERQISSYG